MRDARLDGPPRNLHHSALAYRVRDRFQRLWR